MRGSRGVRLARRVSDNPDEPDRTVEHFLRAFGDRLYARASVTKWPDGDRHRSWALVVGRWKRTLRYQRTPSDGGAV